VHLAGEQWAAYFRDFTVSAFRLETLSAYNVDDEFDEYQRFLAGERPPADLYYGWLDTVAGHAAAGRSMQRVRVVSRPLSDYVRYEFEWGYEFNVKAGEDIRILDVTNRDVELPDLDFWMFDSTAVVHMNYDETGAVSSRELIENPDLDKYLAWRDLALSESVPFGEYRP